MDSFSIAALVSSTSSVSQRAVFGAGEIRSLQRTTAAASQGQPPLRDLATLADLLEKAGRDAEALGRALGASSAVAERLREKLRDALAAGETMMAGLGKQLMRLEASSLASVYVSYVHRQQRVVLAYSDLFQYYAQIVALPSKEHQDQRLDTKDWHHLTEAATQAAHEATQPPNTIMTIRASGPDDTTPPIYTAPASQPDSPSPEQDRGGFGSFVSSLKAMVSSVLPKPDPLVCALCEACARGDTRLVQGLLDQGANVDGRNENRDTPMNVAIQANQIDAAALLAAAGADVEGAHGAAKLPALFQAAAAGHTGMARMLLDRGCDPRQAAPHGGKPYFYDVVDRGSVDGARLLLQHGCDAGTTNGSGQTAIAAAVRRDCVPMVELLIAHGAQIHGTCHSSGGSLLGGTKNVDMVRVLADAVAERNLPVAHLLLGRGARGDRHTLAGQPLVVAAIRDRQLPVRDKTELVRRLLQRGAKGTATDGGVPALRWALEQPAGAGAGLADVVALLLLHGAEANRCVMNDKTGETALLYVVRSGRAAEAGHLLKHGANPNEGGDGKLRSGGTPLPSPLVQAVVRRDADMIRLLRAYGAKLDETMLEFARTVVEQPQIYETITARPVRGGTSSSSGRQSAGLSMQGEMSSRAASPPPAYETVLS
ncbi:Ankyrin repeat-containing domain [Cordyceps militaris]|uniref:Ankyrin repeat-containing domain n=1 Tax=Cordyceps militaris TaxID=73501 RepID=A0A2H4SEZ9_CORMI|nr:Ankyrin repeat-containing domain [Cordyceps militaris]